MFSSIADINAFTQIVGFALFGAILALLLAPAVSFALYKYKIIKGAKTEVGTIYDAKKGETPTMGGILIIFVIAIITFLFNWERSYTWVPIGVMLLASLLGFFDDVLNIWGKERKYRSFSHLWKLCQVHKSKMRRFFYLFLLPWAFIRSFFSHFGSNQKKGVQVHEKLILQFLAGAISAWWIYFKLGESWHYLYIPFLGEFYLGVLIIPLVILVVMFMANAVNIADGMDGLAGGMLISTFGGLAVLSWVGGFEEMAILNATAVGAIIVYTYFNIKPARFEMGDVGSLGLGALLAINALVIGVMGSLLFLSFIFCIEALSVLIQTFSKRIFGKRVFYMSPIHYHFILKGWSEEKTIMRFWVLQMVFVIFGVWFALQ